MSKHRLCSCISLSNYVVHLFVDFAFDKAVAELVTEVNGFDLFVLSVSLFVGRPSPSNHLPYFPSSLPTSPNSVYLSVSVPACLPACLSVCLSSCLFVSVSLLFV